MITGLMVLVVAGFGFIVFLSIEPLPKSKDVKKLFLEEHSGAQILRVDLTEGDGEHIYWRVSFTRQSSDRILTQEYGFRADRRGGWANFFKSAELPKT